MPGVSASALLRTWLLCPPGRHCHMDSIDPMDVWSFGVLGAGSWLLGAGRWTRLLHCASCVVRRGEGEARLIPTAVQRSDATTAMDNEPSDCRDGLMGCSFTRTGRMWKW
ncbi:hypothetical protein B0I35DRAFT_430339 [Stachybotrys elegans]|uniref:Uncharacterized protein n=1 Tax=Stachybotrys elegans TaxID=80388 RepID=A0A8K0SRI7_9HYPO|nr:hypothetical protein B0I35DRAFT_430339 [Stachybotrys elegans]